MDLSAPIKRLYSLGPRRETFAQLSTRGGWPLRAISAFENVYAISLTALDADHVGRGQLNFALRVRHQADVIYSMRLRRD